MRVFLTFLLILIFIIACLATIFLYKKEKSIWSCVNWIIAVAALILGIWNQWDNIETKQQDKQIRIEKLLNESWDLLGGKEGEPNKPSTEFRRPLKRDEQNITQAERKLDEAKIIDPDNPKVIKMEGDIFLSKGEYEKAREKFELSINKDPKYASAYGALAECYAHLGKIKDAIETQKKALKIQPKSAVLLQNLGISYLIDRQLTSGIQMLKESLDLKPDNPHALMYLGVALFYEGDKKNGIKKVERAIELDQKNALYHCHLGLLKYDNDQINDAVKSFEASVNIEPTYSLALFNLGYCQYKLRKFQSAKEYFERVTYVDPTDPDAYKGLELVLIEIGDVEEAMVAGRKAKELGYDAKRTFKVGRQGGILSSLKKQ